MATSSTPASEAEWLVERITLLHAKLIRKYRLRFSVSYLTKLQILGPTFLKIRPAKYMKKNMYVLKCWVNFYMVGAYKIVTYSYLLLKEYRQSLLALHTIRLMIWFNTYVANLFVSMLFIHLKLGIADTIPSFQWRFFFNVPHLPNWIIKLTEHPPQTFLWIAVILYLLWNLLKTVYIQA